MRKLLYFLVLGIFLIPFFVLADGVVFIDYSEKVYLPSQKAVISWDGQGEILILSTKIKTNDLANMAWVIPVPSIIKPEVEKGDIGIFYDLADLFSEDIEAPGFGLGVGSIRRKATVEVIESKKVDIYDITILKATNASDLVNWLNNNGYIVSVNSIPILQEYCNQENFYFIANKINLANKYQDLEINDEERVCSEMIQGRLSPTDPIPLEQQAAYHYSEIEPCFDADFEIVKTLVELEQGVATPLRIEFQPQAPFYPMRISSINEGESVVDVYIFAPTPVRDSSEILATLQMTKIESSLKADFQNKYGLSSDYITYLKYSGDLKKLNSDSWFEVQKYNPELDFMLIGKKRARRAILETLLGFIIFIAIVVIVIFVIVKSIKKISNKISKK